MISKVKFSYVVSHHFLLQTVRTVTLYTMVTVPYMAP